MNTSPLRWCHYDHCHEFDPQSWNAIYCPDCRCKRKAENQRKRLTAPVSGDEELWKLQENRKLGLLEQKQAKNDWLLANSRIGFFDIETSNLDASIGMMLMGCIKERKGGVFTRIVSPNSAGLLDDHEAVVSLRDELESYDYVVTFYGTGFDIPYLNSRLIIHGERPINRLRHVDVYYVARTHLKLHSNRLAVVGETLGLSVEKTRVVGPIWTRALMGDQESMGYIVDHCIIDVKVLEEAFEKLRGFVNFSATRWKKFGSTY